MGPVSVVIIPTAAAANPSTARAPTNGGMPDSTAANGRGMPIRPVEHTRTSSGRQPIPSATTAHMRSACSRPAAPVAAFALPLLITTADA